MVGYAARVQPKLFLSSRFGCSVHRVGLKKPVAAFTDILATRAMAAVLQPNKFLLCSHLIILKTSCNYTGRQISSMLQAPPVPDVDKENVEFVIFMRAAKVISWCTYPLCGIMTAAYAVCQSKECLCAPFSGIQHGMS